MPCQSLPVPVQLSAVDPTPYQVAATTCSRGNPAGRSSCSFPASPTTTSTGVSRCSRAPTRTCLTTLPGTRGLDFYALAVADPLVISDDETLKSVGSSAELSSGDAEFLPTTSLRIQVPVLLAVGQDDASFCDAAIGLSCASSGAVLAREAVDYSPGACLAAYMLAASGHDINLHPDAPQWFAAANAWVARRVAGGCPAGPA